MLGTKTDFAGRDGFNWWVGEVESVEDPASLGRVKVRIVGWHQKGKVGEDGSSSYLEDLPTDALPWATVLLPTDKPQIKNAGSTCELQVGAFVMGFFMDGDEGQLPCVMGAFRGFKKKSGQGGGSEGGEGSDIDVSRTTIADSTEADKDEYQFQSPQRQAVTGQNVEGGSPFVKSQGATPGGPEGGEEQTRGAISRAEVENPFNVYTNPIGVPSMEGGIADGTSGPLQSGGAAGGFTKDLKRMLTELGTQIGSLGVGSGGSLVSTISGHAQSGNQILKQIGNIANYVTNAVTAMVAPLKELLAQQLRAAIDAFVNLLASIIPLAVVTTIISIIKQIIQGIFCKPVPGFLDAIGNIMDFLGSFVDQIMDLVTNAINQVVKMITDYVTKAIGGIQKAICKVLKTISKVFNTIISAINTIDQLSSIATSLQTLMQIDFSVLANFSNVLNIIAMIVNLIASFIDCGRSARKPKATGWLPLLGTTECSDPGDALAGPGGNTSDDCSSFGEEGTGGNYFDSFFQGINTYAMETKLFLNGARDIDDATPGKEKRIRSGPGGVTTFEDKKGNVHKNVPSNETAIFGRDLIQNVKNNLVHTIEGDYYLKVMGDFHLEVNGSFNENTGNGAGAGAKGKGDNALNQDDNQWTKQAESDFQQGGESALKAVQGAFKSFNNASKNVDLQSGEQEAKSFQTKAGDHAIAYKGDVTIQGNQVKLNGVSGITLDAPDVHTSATAITNKATGEIVNEASWITSFLNCGRMDVIAIFQTMPVFTGSYSLVNGSIVDITMDVPVSSSPSMHVRMALGTSTACGMADIVTGSSAGAHMTLVATPTGGIGEIVTSGSGAIVNQVTSGLLSMGCGTGLAAFGCALGPTQIYGLPVMLN